MVATHEILIAKLKEHSRLSAEDVDEIHTLGITIRSLGTDEDFIRQGDKPKVSALVLSGMVARYHLLADGRRQYLSFSLPGDMPDSQALFIGHMDHAVCAMGDATLATIPHSDLVRSFDRRPSLAFAIWRETLIDAAIFREAITNVGSRDAVARMAHLFCELYYRARASRLTVGNSFNAPISLVQLGETLAMSIATVNRTLSALRQTQAVEFKNGVLTVDDWPKLAELGEFDPGYLHLKAAPRL